MTIYNVINTIFHTVCVHSIEHNMFLNLADSNICNYTCRNLDSYVHMRRGIDNLHIVAEQCSRQLQRLQ